MPWPCGLVLKNGVKRLAWTSALRPGPESSIDEHDVAVARGEGGA